MIYFSWRHFAQWMFTLWECCHSGNIAHWWYLVFIVKHTRRDASRHLTVGNLTYHFGNLISRTFCPRECCPITLWRIWDFRPDIDKNKNIWNCILFLQRCPFKDALRKLIINCSFQGLFLLLLSNWEWGRMSLFHWFAGSRLPSIQPMKELLSQ